MTTRIVTAPYALSFGHLIWWSINTGLYDPVLLLDKAQTCKIPPTVVDALTTTKDKNAWDRATALRERNHRIELKPGEYAFYTVRDIDTSNRLLIREVLDENNAQLSIKQLGLLSFSNTFRFDPEAPFFEHEEEARSVIDRMQADFTARIGKIDDNKVRNALLDWLDERHRVVVRRAGGVYYIPNSNNDKVRDEITKEIQSVDCWLKETGLGTFWAVEMYEGQTTVREDYVQLAIDEIDSQLKDVEGRLKSYAESKGMNDGSRMEASRSQVALLETVFKKVAALEESLGDKIGIVSVKAQLIMRKASSMHSRSLSAVEATRQAKGTYVISRKKRGT